MTKKLRIDVALFATVFISLIISFLFCVNINAASGDSVEVVFTSDVHSFIESYDDYVGDGVANIGGYARFKTYFDERRAENPDLMLVDGGDIVMGTLPQALMDEEAIELRTLCWMKYDALTFGNHEFDYGAKALGDMYTIAAERENYQPELIICNIDWSANDEYTNTLKSGLSSYGFSDYKVFEKNGIKIAVTGVLGYDAIKCAPTCELTFIDPIEAVKATVEKIQKDENPDFIMCISHSGTGAELGKTEDEILAKKVPALDVIISGHTHTVLEEEVVVGDTHIVSCGAYGKYVGDIKLYKNGKGRWDTEKYELVLMDENVKADEETLALVDEMTNAIDEKILDKYNYYQDDVIAHNDYIFESIDDLYEIHEEARLGNLLADAYRYIANSTPTGQKTQFDASVAPSGTIRGTFVPGKITVSKAFEMLSLGEGKDGSVGYPLVSLYLTGKEIKTMAEVDASVSDLMHSARLYVSGVCFEFNPYRMILNKVSDIWLNSPILNESRTEIEDDKLYRVVTDYYSMSMLGSVTDLSKGILSIVPKDENGNPITNFDNAIIYDKEGRELKAWVALVEYLKSFPQENNGVSTIPEYYNSTHNRKIVNKTLNPISLVKNSNKIFYVCVVIILFIIVLITLIIKTSKKKKNRKKVFIE